MVPASKPLPKCELHRRLKGLVWMAWCGSEQLRFVVSVSILKGERVHKSGFSALRKGNLHLTESSSNAAKATQISTMFLGYTKLCHCHTVLGFRTSLGSKKGKLTSGKPSPVLNLGGARGGMNITPIMALLSLMSTVLLLSEVFYPAQLP